MERVPDEPQGALRTPRPDTSAGSAPSAAPPAREGGGYARLWSTRLGMMRPGNCAMAAVGVLVGMALVPHAGLGAVPWIAAPLAAFLLAGFGNVLNDLRDHRLDEQAHPERALPSGRMTRNAATAWAVVLLVLGLWEAYLARGVATLLFAVANATALVAYELALKRLGLPGNVLVAALVASTFAFGAWATGVAPADWGLLGLLMAMAFLANVARELLKDVEDMDSDRGRRRTLPLQAGAGMARLLAFLLTNAAVLLSALAFLRGPDAWTPWWLLPLAGADLLFVAGSSLAWVDVARAQRVLKLAMLLALAAFLVGALVPT